MKGRVLHTLNTISDDLIILSWKREVNAGTVYSSPIILTVEYVKVSWKRSIYYFLYRHSAGGAIIRIACVLVSVLVHFRDFAFKFCPLSPDKV